MQRLFEVTRGPLDKPLPLLPVHMTTMRILVCDDRDARDFNEFLVTEGYVFSVTKEIPSYVTMYAPMSLDDALYLVLGYLPNPKEVTLNESDLDQPLRPSDA